MAEINILVAIDVERIREDQLGTGSTKDTPCIIANDQADKYIRMIATDRDAVVGSNGGSELNIELHTGDTVRWRETSLSMGENYSVSFYKFGGPAFDGYVDTPIATTYSVDKPMPKDGARGDQNPSWDPQRNSTTDWSWSATAMKGTANVSYNLSFAIYQRGSDQPLGFYTWDPYFSISQRR